MLRKWWRAPQERLVRKRRSARTTRFERELAARLRNSSREERKTLYASLYTDLVTSEGLVLPTAPTETSALMRQFERYLDPDTVFLEIGAGDCRLSVAIAERVRFVYAIEVSAAITKNVVPPRNLEVLSRTDSRYPFHQLGHARVLEPGARALASGRRRRPSAGRVDNAPRRVVGTSA
jgi:hypothetical protein